MILKKYKNQLFQFLKDHPIGFNNFELIESENALKLEYKNTPFFFVINGDVDFDLFYCSCISFQNGYPHIDLSRGNSEPFSDIIGQLKYWINNDLAAYNEEREAIDLWEEYNKGETLLDIEQIDFGDKTNFSIDEQKQIALSINELKSLIQANFAINSAQLALVNARLDYLIESSQRLNRFDWKSIAVNTIISISVAMSFDTQQGTQLFELFKQVFRIVPALFHVNSGIVIP